MRIQTDAQRETENIRALQALAHGGTGAGVPKSVVKSLREQRGLSQNSLARQSGVDQANLSKMETGTLRVTTKTAGRLAPVLGVSGVELEAAETVASLKRRVDDNEASIEEVLDAATSLAQRSEMFPEGSQARQVADDVISGMISIIQEGMAQIGEGSLPAAQKSALSDEFGEQPDPTRDHLGNKMPGHRSWERGDQSDLAAAQKSAQDDKTQPDPNRDESGRSKIKSWEK